MRGELKVRVPWQSHALQGSGFLPRSGRHWGQWSESLKAVCEADTRKIPREASRPASARADAPALLSKLPRALADKDCPWGLSTPNPDLRILPRPGLGPHRSALDDTQAGHFGQPLGRSKGVKVMAPL